MFIFSYCLCQLIFFCIYYMTNYATGFYTWNIGRNFLPRKGENNVLFSHSTTSAQILKNCTTFLGHTVRKKLCPDVSKQAQRFPKIGVQEQNKIISFSWPEKQKFFFNFFISLGVCNGVTNLTAALQENLKLPSLCCLGLIRCIVSWSRSAQLINTPNGN